MCRLESTSSSFALWIAPGTPVWRKSSSGNLSPASRAWHNRTMTPTVVKSEPKSEGITTPRKKKPKELAVITECCTGCAGSPACVPYCPVADCMYWVPDEDHAPLRRIEVDPTL